MSAHGEDRPLSASELAQYAGVAPNTIRSWTQQADRPLAFIKDTGWNESYTIAQLRAFCAAHPNLTGVRRARHQLDADPGGLPDDRQPEQVRAAVLNLRIAAQAALDVAAIAARQAEQNAAAHREQIDRLALMIRSYDDLLTQFTAPATPAG